jgi:hypothetical protein
LLPLGRRNEHLVVANWPTLAPIFKQMMLDAVPLDEHVSLTTRVARYLARWQVAARYRRKHVGAIATSDVSVAPVEG